jgi:cytochrome c oxidase assembly factor CtaG
LRRALFSIGVLLTVVALVPPLHDVAFDALTMHLLQNVILAEWAPALLVFGLAPDAGRRLAALVPLWAALPLWLATYFVWHVPTLYEAALRNPTPLLHLEHACYVVAGIALWLPVAHGRYGPGTKAAYLFGAFLLASPVGLLLALLPEPIYEFYDGHWGLTALEDQQLAGITMSTAEAAVFFAAFAYYVRRFMADES